MADVSKKAQDTVLTSDKNSHLFISWD